MIKLKASNQLLLNGHVCLSVHFMMMWILKAIFIFTLSAGPQITLTERLTTHFLTVSSALNVLCPVKMLDDLHVMKSIKKIIAVSFSDCEFSTTNQPQTASHLSALTANFKTTESLLQLHVAELSRKNI